MARFALILVFVAVTNVIQGAPPNFDEIFEAAKARNWEKLQEFIKRNLDPNTPWNPPSFDSIRSLHPPEGGKVYGEAEYTFQSSSNINGHESQESGGHKVINDNGKVNEFDFTPSRSLDYTPSIPRSPF